MMDRAVTLSPLVPQLLQAVRELLVPSGTLVPADFASVGPLAGAAAPALEPVFDVSASEPGTVVP